MTTLMTEAPKASTGEVSLRGYIERTNNGKRKGNGLVIDPAVVVEIEGFNTRTAGMGELYYSMPHVVEHLNSLANAYMEDALAVMPISVQIVDSKPVLRQGACRIRSIAIANRTLEALGKPRISEIRVEEFRGSNAKAELFTLTGNSTLSLSVVAEALSVKRLIEDPVEPMTFADLAVKRGKSEQHLRQLVRVLDLPNALQAMLVSDEVSMYVALTEYTYSGEKAIDNIRKAIEVYGKATASTIKHIKAVAISTEKQQQSPANEPQNPPDSDVNVSGPGAGEDNVITGDAPGSDTTVDNESLNDGVQSDLNSQTDEQQQQQQPPTKDLPANPPMLSSVLNKKTVNVIADTAIPIFERISKQATLSEGESLSEDTYTLVLTNDEMNAIINAHDDMVTFLNKHKAKQGKV
ncbi:DNA-binding protein [Escherichia coli]|nr:DNA-binding protein [Escherichia coli]